MILQFTDPIDGEDKTFEVYSTEKGTICVAVYEGLLTREEVEEEGHEVDSFISLTVEDWAILLSAVNQEAVT